MRPLACCADDPKCPTSPVAHTDFSTQYGDVAITRIRVLMPNYLCHITVSCVYATLKPPQKCNCHARTGIDIREMLAKCLPDKASIYRNGLRSFLDDVQAQTHLDPFFVQYITSRSVLFFSRPRSEGWPHHGRTFSQVDHVNTNSSLIHILCK